MLLSKAPALPGCPSAPPCSKRPQIGLRSKVQTRRTWKQEAVTLTFTLLQAGNLTVLATAPLLHQDPVQLDFHFRLTPQTSAHWHGLLCDHRLFLEIPYRALDQGNRER